MKCPIGAETNIISHCNNAGVEQIGIDNFTSDELNKVYIAHPDLACDGDECNISTCMNEINIDGIRINDNRKGWDTCGSLQPGHYRTEQHAQKECSVEAQKLCKENPDESSMR